MVYTFSTSPAILASSPPARSPAVPIKRGVGKSVPVQAKQGDGGTDRMARVSEEGSRRASFSSSRTPFASASSGGGKPPAGPSVAAKAQQICVGFDAPASKPNQGPASPSKLHTKASLLSQQLLDSAFSASLDFSDILSPRPVYKVSRPFGRSPCLTEWSGGC
jgi:hypothetical protein